MAMGLVALAVAIGWVVWIVNAYRDPAEAEPPVLPVASAPVVVAPPAAPIPETPQEECARLWKAGQGGELIKAMNRWLSLPTHPVAELVAWLLKLEAGPARDAAMAGIAPQLPPEPRLTLALAASGAEAHRRQMAEALALWAGSDAPAALAWLDQHKDDPAHFPAQTALLMAWAAKQPREAAKHVGTAWSDAAEQGRAVDALLRRWMGKDAASAGRWLEILPRDSLRLTSGETFTRGWAKVDLPGAADWVEQLPPGSLRDHAVRVLVEVMAPTDAEEARQWAEQISDEKMRQACLASLSGK